MESFLFNDAQKTLAPTTLQRVHCPTCGGSAERYHLAENSTVRTQCSSCDYLMTVCAETGRVIEAYAPSFSPAAFASSLAVA
ncbi:MAG: replication restart DNA helicase PriA [Phormidesmis sp. RL_2_1]|nr:replication restart DNA helicase PriA [Phormidesmis sp. RL_2_1]